MARRVWLVCVVLFFCGVLARAGVSNPAIKLTAAQIADRNASARGGLQAWRAVYSISMSGKMDAGGAANVQLPFVLEMKRPRKSRLKLEFEGQVAVQVYDGVSGWKLRPFLGRKSVEPYTTDELKSATWQADLDGPLMDYAAKGSRVELEGGEKVENRDTYKLKLTMKNGEVRHIWIDAETFLDVKIEGDPRRLDGRLHSVEIYFRDYRPVQGLMIPYLLETTVEQAKRVPGKGMALQDMTQKIIIESVALNPKLADSRFTKPKADDANENWQEALKTAGLPLP